MSFTKVLTHNRFWRIAALLLADVLFFGGTNSNRVASYLLIVGFILLVCTIYQIIYCLFSFARFYGIPFRHKQRLALYVTGIVGFALALQSIGELGSRDVLVLVPLAIVAYVYSAYGKSDKEQIQ